jgi:endonuclease IV
LEVFHLNDSLNKFGSKMDRHAHLGRGYIFWTEEGTDDNIENLDGLRVMLNKNKYYNIPMIGEFSDGLGQQDIDLINTLI